MGDMNVGADSQLSAVDCRFRKRERIVSRQLIDTLFGGGAASLVAYPLRVVYMTVPERQGAAPVQMLVSVPKKRFHHAVDRNRVKRQVREVFRHHKLPLYQALPANTCLLVAFVWLGDEHRPSAEIAHRVERLVQRISEQL